MLCQLPTWTCKSWECWESFLVATRRGSNASESQRFRIPLPVSYQILPHVCVHRLFDMDLPWYWRTFLG